ncbi:hypothetical protein QU38_01310, partial [Staphylococcus aureus]
VPAHELVQPTKASDALGAGAQHQVIGVAEDDVGTRGADIGGLHRPDGGGGAGRPGGGRAGLAPLRRGGAKGRPARGGGGGGARGPAVLTMGGRAGQGGFPPTRAGGFPPYPKHSLQPHGAFSGGSVYVAEPKCAMPPAIPCT